MTRGLGFELKLLSPPRICEESQYLPEGRASSSVGHPPPPQGLLTELEKSSPDGSLGPRSVATSHELACLRIL